MINEIKAIVGKQSSLRGLRASSEKNIQVKAKSNPSPHSTGYEFPTHECRKKHTNRIWKRIEIQTWPPTTAIAGKESHRVGKALESPWSPRAVQALCILLTREIRFSILLYCDGEICHPKGCGENTVAARADRQDLMSPPGNITPAGIDLRRWDMEILNLSRREREIFYFVLLEKR